MRAFPEDFVAHLEDAVPLPRLYRLPKIVDIADGAVTYDTRSPLEQPDGTYVDIRRAG